MHSGTQSHTEGGVSTALSKTPIRRSWLQVRLHMEMIDCAIEALLPELDIVLQCACRFENKLIQWDESTNIEF